MISEANKPINLTPHALPASASILQANGRVCTSQKASIPEQLAYTGGYSGNFLQDDLFLIYFYHPVKGSSVE